MSHDNKSPEYVDIGCKEGESRLSSVVHGSCFCTDHSSHGMNQRPVGKHSSSLTSYCFNVEYTHTHTHTHVHVEGGSYSNDLWERCCNRYLNADSKNKY